MKDTSEIIIDEIAVRRLRLGQWVEVPLMVSYHPETQSLEIRGELRKRKQVFAEVDLYRVEPIPVQEPMKGAGYILHRSQKAIEEDPEQGLRYEVLVGPTEDKDLCSCRGHYGNDRCKHTDALRWLGSKLGPVACGKCGQTDVELRGGLCGDCRPKPAPVPVATQAPELPEWLKDRESEIPF